MKIHKNKIHSFNEYNEDSIIAKQHKRKTDGHEANGQNVKGKEKGDNYWHSK